MFSFQSGLKEPRQLLARCVDALHPRGCRSSDGVGPDRGEPASIGQVDGPSRDQDDFRPGGHAAKRLDQQVGQAVLATRFGQREPLHGLLQQRGGRRAGDPLRRQAAGAQVQVAAALATQVGHHRGGETDGQLDVLQIALTRRRRLPKIDQHGQIAMPRLLELANDRPTQPGRGSPMDPPPAVAAAPLAHAVEVAVDALMPLAAVLARKRLLTPRRPSPGQLAQTRKDGQGLDLVQRDRPAEQAERESSRQSQRPQPIATAPGEPAAVDAAARLARRHVRKQHPRTDRFLGGSLFPGGLSPGRRRAGLATDLLFHDQGPAAPPPAQVAQPHVGHQQIARTDSLRGLAPHLESVRRPGRRPPAEQHGPGKHARQHQQQIDLAQHGPRADHCQHQQVVPAFEADGGSAETHHSSNCRLCRAGIARSAIEAPAD